MDAISQTANEIAQELGAAAIITPTRTGHTPRLIARYRPSPPIFATTPPMRKPAGSRTGLGGAGASDCTLSAHGRYRPAFDREGDRSPGTPGGAVVRDHRGSTVW